MQIYFYVPSSTALSFKIYLYFESVQRISSLLAYKVYFGNRADITKW